MLLLNCQYLRDQIVRHRVQRALRTMKQISSFDSALHSFVQEETKREADAVLSDKDIPRSEFNLENIRKFSHKAELDKFRQTNPLLLGAIIGTK